MDQCKRKNEEDQIISEKILEFSDGVIVTEHAGQITIQAVEHYVAE